LTRIIGRHYLPPTLRRGTPTSAGRRVALLVAAAALLLPAASAQASSIRVPADYYGVNFQKISKITAAAGDMHLTSLARLGIDQVRFNLSWALAEPTAPKNGVHTYHWGTFDQQIAAMARHGVRGQPTLTQAPSWNAPDGTSVDLKCNKASSRAPLAIAPYAEFTRAFAARYGRGGAFWQQNPSLPYTPVTRYEIWNEPNLMGGWCPGPDPWHYADMFVGAARAIRAVDPNAQVMVGGLAPPSAQHEKDPEHYRAISTFLSAATTHNLAVAQLASAVAVHVYPALDPFKQLTKLAWFRSQLRAGHIADSTPMLVNEVGWATHVGKTPITEDQRATAYSQLTVNYARTNCNVLGILPQTWMSNQQSNSNPEDWYGIAGPGTANPYESALAYSQGVALMRGQLQAEAPRNTIMACDGMPPPDSDGDGYADQTDYYPLDPARH
jgi:hypothetical protein